MELNFQCHKETAWGEEVFISGNIEELGEWNISKAIKMSSSKYPLWSINIELVSEKDTDIEYKFFVKNECNKIKWDRGLNRELKLFELEEIMGKKTEKSKKIKHLKKIEKKKEKRKKKDEKKNYVKKIVNVIKEKKLHEVIVLATMSSGKSTFINALLGEDLLPNENQACTAKIFKVIDNDRIKENKLTVKKKDNTILDIQKEDLYKLNTDSEVHEILIEGDFEGIKNRQIDDIIHQICLVDTPGPNNSLDSSHKEIAYELLNDKNTSHLVYVLNSTQIGVNDDKKLLLDILEMSKSFEKDFKIIFVLNKADEILMKDESIEALMKSCKNYLENLGYDEPKILPISAYAAKLFKFALEGNLKTRKEKADFSLYFDLFEDKKLSELNPKSLTSGEIVEIKGIQILKSQIIKCLYATGIIDIEKELECFLEDKILKK